MATNELQYVRAHWDIIRTIPLDREFKKDETSVSHNTLNYMRTRGLVRRVRVVFDREKGTYRRVWAATDRLKRCAQKILSEESGGVS